MTEIIRFVEKEKAEEVLARLESKGIHADLRFRESVWPGQTHYSLYVEDAVADEAERLLRPPVSDEDTRKAENLRDRLLAEFKCVKCGHPNACFKRISTAGAGLSKIMDWQYNTFIVLSCEKCGRCEFYDADVLGEHHAIGTVLDILLR